MTDLIPTGGNAFTNTSRTTGASAHCPAAGPDPLIAAIRRNFETATAAYGIEPPGDVGVLLREFRRLEVVLAESTKIGCNCSGKSDDDVTPEQFDAMLDAGEPVELAADSPAEVRHVLEGLTEDGGQTWTVRQLQVTDGFAPMLNRPLSLNDGDSLTLEIGNRAHVHANTVRIRHLAAHIDVLVRLLADFARAGDPGDSRGMQVRTLLAENLADPGSRDEFLNRNGIVLDVVDAHWLECPTGNCRHSVFMHDDGPDPRCRARDCQGEECGPEGSIAADEDEE